MIREAAGRAALRPAVLLRALRPRQWIKNGLLLAGILFTLDQPHPGSDWLRVAAAVAIFCALASAVYLVNDVCDLEQDRLHPRKSLRPLAAGELGVPAALTTAGLLTAAGAAGAWLLGGSFTAVVGLYLALTLSYSAWLKHVVLVDVLALAACYVLRAIAGAVVIAVEISPWLLVCTTLGALLLGLAKRRNELVTLEEAGRHRKILDEYSRELLDQLIVLIAASTLMAYMLYTFTSRTAQQRPLMMVTIPFVIYGIFRFFYLMHRRGKGGDPSSELIEDPSLLLCGFLWALTAGAVMLLGPP